MSYDVIRLIQPSGDWSGDTDTAAINAAASDLEFDPSARKTGAVILAGKYYINDTLDMGSSTSSPVALLAAGTSVVRQVAAAADKYAIIFTGATSSRSRATMMQGISLECHSLCRGVKFNYLPHHRLMVDSYIYAPEKVGVDAFDCWGSHISDSTITSGTGISLRTRNFNNGHIDNMTLYGSDSSWPDIADTVATTITGSEIQTPDANRACVNLHGRGIICKTLTFEGSDYGAYPLIYTTSGRSVIDGVWMEGTTCTNARIVAEDDGSTLGNLEIARIDGTSFDTAGSCRSFLELRGTTSYITVRDSSLFMLGTSVIYAANGTHTRISVRNVVTTSNAIARADHLAADAVASIDGAAQYIDETSDSNAPNGTLYYSTDLGALAYKSSAGLVTAIQLAP